MNTRETERGANQSTMGVPDHRILSASRGGCQIAVVVLHPTLHCNGRCPHCYSRPASSRIQEASLPDEYAYLEALSDLPTLEISELIVAGGGEPTDFDRFDELLDLIARARGRKLLFSNLNGRRIQALMDRADVFDEVVINLNGGQQIPKPEVLARAQAISGRGPSLTGIIVSSGLCELESTVRRLGPISSSIVRCIHVSSPWGTEVRLRANSVRRVIQSAYDGPVFIEENRDAIRGPQGRIYCGSRFFDVTVGRDLRVYPCSEMAYNDLYAIAELNAGMTLATVMSEPATRLRTTQFWQCRKCFLAPLNRRIKELDLEFSFA